MREFKGLTALALVLTAVTGPALAEKVSLTW